MNRAQLAHILRAAATIVDDPNILVIGSQSVLATFDDPTEVKADAVDGAIGELSPFHEMNGVYAQGVSVRTAVLPVGWRDRVVSWSNQSTGRAQAAFLEPHDCVVSKLVAYRDKDFAFAAAMLESGPIDPTILAARIDLLPASLDPRVQTGLRSWLKTWVDRHRTDL